MPFLQLGIIEWEVEGANVSNYVFTDLLINKYIFSNRQSGFFRVRIFMIRIVYCLLTKLVSNNIRFQMLIKLQSS